RIRRPVHRLLEVASRLPRLRGAPPRACLRPPRLRRLLRSPMARWMIGSSRSSRDCANFFATATTRRSSTTRSTWSMGWPSAFPRPGCRGAGGPPKVVTRRGGGEGGPPAKGRELSHPPHLRPPPGPPPPGGPPPPRLGRAHHHSLGRSRSHRCRAEVSR